MLVLSRGGVFIQIVSRRTFLLGGMVALASYTYFETTSVQIVHYTLKLNRLPRAFNGFTILHVTDLHSKLFGEQQNNLLGTIQGLAYDMVAFTGDLDNKYSPDPKPGLQLIQGLSDKPVYFVPGNHDWWTGYSFKEDLIQLGVMILENKSVQFTKNDAHIWIVGVDDPYSGRDRLDLALEAVTDDLPRVLLAHAPEIYPSAVKSNIDVVLVGHTHGGQVRLPLVGAVIVPGQGLFPRLDYGFFDERNTKMIINGGLGESVIPIRCNIRPELVLIKLESNEDGQG